MWTCFQMKGEKKRLLTCCQAKVCSSFKIFPWMLRASLKAWTQKAFYFNKNQLKVKTFCFSKAPLSEARNRHQVGRWSKLLFFPNTQTEPQERKQNFCATVTFGLDSARSPALPLGFCVHTVPFLLHLKVWPALFLQLSPQPVRKTWCTSLCGTSTIWNKQSGFFLFDLSFFEVTFRFLVSHLEGRTFLTRRFWRSRNLVTSLKQWRWRQHGSPAVLTLPFQLSNRNQFRFQISNQLCKMHKKIQQRTAFFHTIWSHDGENENEKDCNRATYQRRGRASVLRSGRSVCDKNNNDDGQWLFSAAGLVERIAA